MYNLNVELAKQADGAGYISQTGKYLGKIIKAEHVVSKKGTVGIDFSFESNSGEKANYMTIWTMKENGEQLSGYKTLCAMMTCMRIKSISPQTLKNKEGKDIQIFPELQKPIGLLLAKEPYIKKDGNQGVKMVIEGVFDPQTELTASEILERKTTPQKLGEMVLRLKERPMQMQIGMPATLITKSQPNAPQGVAALDDDIPFDWS